MNIPGEYSLIDMWSQHSILDYGNQTDALHNGAGGTSENNMNRYKKVIYKLNNNKDRAFPLYFTHYDKILTK